MHTASATADLHAGGARRAPPACIPGMTLIEVIVVLVIIMALAASSIVVVDRVTEQAWIESTDRNLEAIVSAIDGDQRTNGSIGGFLADMGRMPEAPTATEPTDAAYKQRWQELTLGLRASDGTALPAWGMRSPLGDAGVSMACGWRGPYVRTSQVWDGWDTVLRVDDGAGLLAWNASGVIRGARSLGQDRNEDTVPEETTAQDRVRRCRAGMVGSLSIAVRCETTAGSPASSGYIIVRIYAVRDGMPVCIWQSSPAWDLASPAVPYPIQANSGAIDPLAGIIAVRAYHCSAMPTASGDQPVASDSASQVVYSTISPWTTPAGIALSVVVP